MLIGDWYVISVAGEPAARGEPAIEVAIGEKTIQAKAHCLRFHWEYSRAGERIRIRPQRNIFVATCHRGMAAWEGRFSRAMLSAAEVSTQKDEFTTISGSEGVVTLRRKWYVGSAVGYSFGAWQVVAIGGSPLAASEVIRLSFENDQIAAQSQCLRWLWSYSRGASNSVAIKEENPGEMCARGLSRNEEVFGKILDGATTIDQRADGTMLIRGEDGEIFARRIPLTHPPGLRVERGSKFP